MTVWVEHKVSVKRIHEGSKESLQSVCALWCKIGIGFTFPFGQVCGTHSEK